MNTQQTVLERNEPDADFSLLSLPGLPVPERPAKAGPRRQRSRMPCFGGNLGDDADDDFDSSGGRRKSEARSGGETAYYWQVVFDPEGCFQGGLFRLQDLQMSAKAGTWPVGIKFRHIRTQVTLLYNGKGLVNVGSAIS